MKVDPMQRVNGFKRVVLHPEKAQDAQQSLKTYRQIFGLPWLGDMSAERIYSLTNELRRYL